eukprot:jgi/Phyca11/102039/e_gw1.6.414.1
MSPAISTFAFGAVVTSVLAVQPAVIPVAVLGAVSTATSTVVAACASVVVLAAKSSAVPAPKFTVVFCSGDSLAIGRVTARTTAGARESASATTFVAPDRYSMEKSYSCKVKDHRCNRPAKLGRVMSHFKAAWSVTMVNVRPYKYGRNSFTDHTTTKHSSSVIE